MKDLILDVKTKLMEHPSLEYVKRAGGVLVLPSLDVFPHQQKTPCIILLDAGTPNVTHLSSKLRKMAFHIPITMVQRVFLKDGVIIGTPNDRGIEEMAKDVREVLDMDRMQGKYFSAFLRSDDSPVVVTNGSIWLQTKSLTFEYARIE